MRSVTIPGRGIANLTCSMAAFWVLVTRFRKSFGSDHRFSESLYTSRHSVQSHSDMNRHAKYKNMFFVGASTHPGTGVPIVICGSKLTADQVDAYLTGKPIDDLAKYEAAAMLLGL